MLKALPKNNKVLQLKLSRYKQYMKNINRDIQVEKAGFVVDYENFVLLLPV